MRCRGGVAGGWHRLEIRAHTAYNCLLDPIETVKPDWIPATVFLRELQTHGYSRISFVRFVTDEKIDNVLSWPRQTFDAFNVVPELSAVRRAMTWINR